MGATAAEGGRGRRRQNQLHLVVRARLHCPAGIAHFRRALYWIWNDKKHTGTYITPHPQLFLISVFRIWSPKIAMESSPINILCNLANIFVI